MEEPRAATSSPVKSRRHKLAILAVAAAAIVIGGVAGTSGDKADEAHAADSSSSAAHASAKGKVKPMKPKEIKMLITRTTGRWRRSSIRPKRASMTPKLTVVKGACKPNSLAAKSIRIVMNPPVKKEYNVFCNGYKSVRDRTGDPDDLLPKKLNRIGTWIADSAGVTEEMRGDVVKARANDRVAVLRFKRPKAGETTVVKPVKSITFKAKGKPKIVKYPAQ